MTSYSHTLAMGILEKAIDNPDNDIISINAKKAMPVLSQANNMYSLLCELAGQFDDKDNSYNEQINYILTRIEEEKEKSQ